MSPDALRALLESVAAGGTAPADALRELAWLPAEPVAAAGDGGAGDAPGAAPYALLDHHRALRNGFPEVVYCPGKSTPQILGICDAFAARGAGFLATRADDGVRAALRGRFPDAEVSDLGRIVHLRGATAPAAPAGPPILIASAGTADLPVAEEAAVTAAAFGGRVERLYDVGVAGLHRLLGSRETLERAGVVIVCAGMEGALASVLGGLVAVPVVAVPTSVGYGASFGGLAALLAMLNSCAAGVTVVNIDNGFGAACAATRINRLISRVQP
jgi:pyridinium-3,5-biscarboxylic acid mononucleotide synthase